MPRQSVERLERRVTEIEQLPDRMDRLELQIVQLRAEMRDEFSAIRQAIQIGDDGGQRSLREEIRAGDEETRRALREEIRNGNVMIATALTEQIGDARTESRSLFEDARRENRVLFEKALARIANIQEGLSATRRTKRSSIFPASSGSRLRHCSCGSRARRQASCRRSRCS
jgi:hypothetical protein